MSQFKFPTYEQYAAMMEQFGAKTSRSLYDGARRKAEGEYDTAREMESVIAGMSVGPFTVRAESVNEKTANFHWTKGAEHGLVPIHGESAMIRATRKCISLKTEWRVNAEAEERRAEEQAEIDRKRADRAKAHNATMTRILKTTTDEA